MAEENEKFELISKMARLEEWKSGAERRIHKLEIDGEALNRLAVLAELQKQSMDIMNESLNKISESNNSIKHEVELIKGSVASVKTNVDKVTDEVQEMKALDTINLPKTLKKVLGWFAAAIATGIAGWFLIQLGLK